MPKELVEQIGNIEVYAYSYPSEKRPGSKLILEAYKEFYPVERKFLRTLADSQDSLREVLHEGVNVESSRGVEGNPGVVRILLNTNDGWRKALHVVKELWGYRRFGDDAQVVLKRLFEAWDIRDTVAQRCLWQSIIEEEVMSLEDYVRAVEELCTVGVLSIKDDVVHWNQAYLKEWSMLLKKSATSRTLFAGERCFLDKVYDHFVLAVNPGLKERLNTPVV